MHVATQLENNEIFDFLVAAFKTSKLSANKKETQINLIDRWGFTCLDTAYDIGNNRFIQILEELKVKRNKSEKNTGLTKHSDELSSLLNAISPRANTNTTNDSTFINNDNKQDIKKTIQILNSVQINDVNSLIS